MPKKKQLSQERVRKYSIGRTDAYKVDPAAVVFDRNCSDRDVSAPQVRLAIDRLKVSIREIGQTTPIEVRMRSKELMVVDGRLRVLAIREMIKEGVDIPFVWAVQEPQHLFGIEHAASVIVRHWDHPLPEERVQNLLAQLAAGGWDPEKISAATGVTVDLARDVWKSVQPRISRRKQQALADAVAQGKPTPASRRRQEESDEASERLLKAFNRAIRAVQGSRSIGEARSAVQEILREQVEEAKA